MDPSMMINFDQMKEQQEAEERQMEEDRKKTEELAQRLFMSGKECRTQLYQSVKRPPRFVPAFSYQSLQKNTIVIPPKKVNIYQKRPVKETFFHIYFKRGDIPVSRSGRAMNPTKPYSDFPVRWFCDPTKLDYCYYLPIFVDGLSDSDIELRQLAQYASMDLVLKAPHKVFPVIPKLILPFKRAFNTRDKKIIISALKVLQFIVMIAPCAGQALVPYYRQLLSVCNMYKNINVNLGSGVDEDRGRRIGDVINDTLKMLELCGGPNAFINIKYMVPTYESNLHPKCEYPTPAQKQIILGHPGENPGINVKI